MLTLKARVWQATENTRKKLSQPFNQRKHQSKDEQQQQILDTLSSELLT
jgi:hypothetical protein